MSINSYTLKDALVVNYAVSASLSGVSTIACIIALGVLLYYKMWRTFIYRLVIYVFMSLIVFSLSNVIMCIYVSIIIRDSLTNETDLLNVIETFNYSGEAFFFFFVTSLTVCIYLMALHNYQFTYKSDLCLLISSIFYCVISISVSVLYNIAQISHMAVIEYLFLGLPILINIVFIALTLVPLCCRACGYNLCMKTAATMESHRKALREIIPFYSLVVPFIIYLMSFFPWPFSIGEIVFINVIYSSPGLVCALSFALHLFFIRKNLKKFRSKKKAPQTTDYGSVQRRTYHVGSFTSEGISETCNTEHVAVSEDEEDTRFLLRKNNIV